MRGDDQEPFLLTRLEQQYPQKWTDGQIERLLRFVSDQIADLMLPYRRRQRAQICRRKVPAPRCSDYLYCISLQYSEARTQDVVTSDDFAEALLEGSRVERPHYAHERR